MQSGGVQFLKLHFRLCLCMYKDWDCQCRSKLYGSPNRH